MAETLWETDTGKRPQVEPTPGKKKPSQNTQMDSGVSGDHPFSGPERARQIKNRNKKMKDIMDDLDNS